ncbi:MAG: hypothetical protein VW862_07550, partial [Euryarchaeota archaeon]
MLKYFLVALAFTAPSLTTPASVFAATQVAIVYDIQGNAQPGVAPFDELSVGAVINLSNEAVLNFVHYKLCKNIKVKGGSIEIEEQTFRVTGGSVLEQTEEQCPERVSLKNESTVVGSIKLRSASKKTPQIGKSPIFLTTSSNWPIGSKISLLNSNNEFVADLNLNGRAASLAKG